MPSRVRPRFGPTGVGAVRRIHSSDAADRPRVPEVVAHQPLDALPRFVARIAEHVRGALLQLVAQHVLIALRLEMQDGADAQQKVLGLLESTRIGRDRAAGGAVSVSAAIVRVAIRSRSAPGASFTSGSS